MLDRDEEQPNAPCYRRPVEIDPFAGRDYGGQAIKHVRDRQPEDDRRKNGKVIEGAHRALHNIAPSLLTAPRCYLLPIVTLTGLDEIPLVTTTSELAPDLMVDGTSNIVETFFVEPMPM